MYPEYRQLCSGQLRRRFDVYDWIAVGCAVGIVALSVAVKLHWI